MGSNEDIVNTVQVLILYFQHLSWQNGKKLKTTGLLEDLICGKIKRKERSFLGILETIKLELNLSISQVFGCFAKKIQH